ncbi:MAG: Na+ dependent nucleoside transporter [Bacteroidetes bacterium]|nr:MAG: Na+ dependent nucleoside transporter [Bacteroidota bacterium]
MTGLGSARRIETYHLSKDERGNLLLTGRERSFMLIGRPDLLQSPFSFTDIIRGLIGILSMLILCWVFSTNRRAIDWRMVSIGIGLQVFFAVMVLKVGWVRAVFEGISGLFVDFLGYSKAGSMFLFGGLVSDFDTFGSIFAFQVLPTIVFFSAMMSILYYLGILQKVVYAFAWLMSRTMRLSGAESLAAAGNVFLGQTESPLLIRPYLAKMTRSEIMALMTGGMATIAGSVFVAYVDYLGGPDIEAKRLFATHLLTASIMSAPAALVAAKILVPETEPVIQDLDVPKERIGSNLLDAITNGTTDGLKLAVNVGVMLLVFTAIVALVNGFLSDLVGVNTGLNDWVAHFTDGRYREFNLQFILGLLLAPIAWLLGVPTDDIMIVGQLLGEKTIINEFFAYATLGTVKAEGTIIHFKSVIIATYALCGFANFASIGIQIGGIGALEPSQRKLLSELGVRSLIGGTVASFLTAAIAGMLSTV